MVRRVSKRATSASNAGPAYRSMAASRRLAADRWKPAPVASAAAPTPSTTQPSLLLGLAWAGFSIGSIGRLGSGAGAATASIVSGTGSLPETTTSTERPRAVTRWVPHGSQTVAGTVTTSPGASALISTTPAGVML